MAGSTLMAIPVVVFFLIVQRKVTAGMTAGAVKENPMTSIVGVDVGGTSTRAVCFDAGLRPIAGTVAANVHGAVDIADLVARLVVEVAARPGAVVIGVPGRVDVDPARVSSAVNLGITRPASIGALVQALVGVPVHIENDVNAAALGMFAYLELAATARWPTRRGHRHRRRVRARRPAVARATGAAGEIGHVPMQSHGPACSCGQSGCAEAVGSGRVVADDPARR